MWSRIKRFVLLAGACGLMAACGFSPMYGKQQRDSSVLLAGVKIDPIEGRTGQLFKAELEDRLNPGGVVPSNPAFRLNVVLTSTANPIGVARDGTISRYNVYLDSKYELYRIHDGKKVAAGQLRQVSSYNNLSNAYFSTYISSVDAISRGVTELAETYRLRLSAYLSNPDSVPMEQEKPKNSQEPA